MAHHITKGTKFTWELCAWSTAISILANQSGLTLQEYSTLYEHFKLSFKENLKFMHTHTTPSNTMDVSTIKQIEK
jgi:hypothetical protein